MTDTLTDRLQQSRLVVVEVDRAGGRLRVKGEACTDLTCHAHTIVVTEDGAEADLDALYPGDVVRIDSVPARRVVVLRRVWEGIASPEL